MKFRYYITDTFNGRILGTEDSQLAEEYAKSEDYFVVDTFTGVWLTADFDRAEDIPAAPSLA